MKYERMVSPSIIGFEASLPTVGREGKGEPEKTEKRAREEQPLRNLDAQI
jgi:hypothetical protein